MTRFEVLGLLCLAMTMPLGGCKKVDDTDPAQRVITTKNKAEVRFRVTVEVNDNGTIRSGSSVWSWMLYKPTLALASAYSGEFKGEAVAVELSDGRVLFALLRGSGAYTDLAMLGERQFKEYWVDGKMDDRVENLRSIAKNVGRSKMLACEQWQEGDARDRSDYAFDCPMLVSFADIDDPASIKLVEADDLPDTFGKGIELEHITIEITDEPVTKGIEKRLLWMPKVYQMGISPDFKPKGIPVGNFRGLFTKENYK